MLNFIDSDAAPLRNVLRTPEGYLAAEASAVRTGIQRYLGSEVGRPDLQYVDVYRPEDEVFSRDAVSTFAHKPVTVDHPPGGVDAASWKDKAVGEVSTEALRDGERLKLQLIVKDAAAVDAVLSGSKRELSAGYSCQLEWKDGQTADGKPYQAIQRNIQINHLALVERGRAGNCMIGDSAPWGIAPVTDSGAAPLNTKEVQMDTKTLVLGDAAVRVVAEDESKVAAYVAQHAQVVADNEKLKGENAALTQKLADAEITPAKLQKLVADRAIVAAGYKELVGRDAATEAPSEQLRREAVAAKLGDEVAKQMSDDAIAGAFAAFTASIKKADDDPLRGGPTYNDSSSVSEAYINNIFDAAGVPMKKGA